MMSERAVTGQRGPGAGEFSGSLAIQQVERHTGISKALLRMWEQRYGFPAPERSESGERLYSAEQITKLHFVRRLIGSGYRPGKLVGMSLEELDDLLIADRQGNRHFLDSELERELLEVLLQDDEGALEGYLSLQYTANGLDSFIRNFMRMANVIVGDAWLRGQISVSLEHAYSRQVQALMHKILHGLDPGELLPRVLLATVPGEQHALGLLMVEGLLRQDGIDVFNLGVEVSTSSLASAVSAHRVNVVGLSFSSSFAPSRAVPILEEIRLKLPQHVEIWVGGNGVRSCRRDIANIEIVSELEDVRLKVVRWRQSRL